MWSCFADAYCIFHKKESSIEWNIRYVVGVENNQQSVASLSSQRREDEEGSWGRVITTRSPCIGVPCSTPNCVSISRDAAASHCTIPSSTLLTTNEVQGISIKSNNYLFVDICGVCSRLIKLRIRHTFNKTKDSDHIIEVYYFSGVQKEPKFVDVIENITVPAGRNVKFSCSVDNLGTYKVSKHARSKLSACFP